MLRKWNQFLKLNYLFGLRYSKSSDSKILLCRTQIFKEDVLSTLEYFYENELSGCVLNFWGKHRRSRKTPSDWSVRTSVGLEKMSFGLWDSSSSSSKLQFYRQCYFLFIMPMRNRMFKRAAFFSYCIVTKPTTKTAYPTRCRHRTQQQVHTRISHDTLSGLQAHLIPYVLWQKNETLYFLDTLLAYSQGEKDYKRKLLCFASTVVQCHVTVHRHSVNSKL